MTTTEKIKQHIQRLPRGKSFVSRQLLHLGSRAAIDQVLARLVKVGAIARVQRGVFVKPEHNTFVGNVLPSAVEVAQQLSKASGFALQIHGAEAARRFKLSTQVMTKPVLLTNGPSRHIRVGNTEVELKRVSSRKLAMAGLPSGEALSALWYLGKEHVTPEIVERVRRHLSEEEYERLTSHRAVMPGWMIRAFEHHKAQYAGG